MKNHSLLALLVLLLTCSISRAQNNQTFNYQGFVFQNYTIPTSGYYLLSAKGGEGGSNNGYAGGKGASMSCYYFFNAGTQLRISVAGAGESESATLFPTGAGGGGSSTVVITDGGSSYTPVIIAGGGGGAGNGLGGGDGQIIPSGTAGKYNDGSTANSGGISGGGGATNTSYDGGGGAGFNTDGGTSYKRSTVNAWGGQAYLSGNYGGGGHPGGDGGWGGGGEGGKDDFTPAMHPHPAEYNYGGGGGGGGYSGGGAGGTNRYTLSPTVYSGGGGGGGSFIATNANTNGLVQLSGDNSGNGMVSITGPNTTTDVVNSPFNPYTWPANGTSYSAAGTYYYIDSANAVTRILDLSFGLQSCSSYIRVDTTVVSCGGYTSPLNGRTYTENSTDSIRIGCTKYVAQIIVAPPSSSLAIPEHPYVCIAISIMVSTTSAHDHATKNFLACRNTSETYRIPEVPYASSYIWNLPPGATGTSTTNTITVSFSNRFNGGKISVSPVNSCGVGDTVCAMIDLVKNPPAGHLIITGPSGRVSGTYHVEEIVGASAYTWSVSNNQAVIVSGQGTPDIHLEALPGFTRANLSVVASNCKGNGARGNMPLNDNGGSLGTVFVRRASKQATISVYPNPSNGQFTISTPSLQTDATLEVYSTEGRLVYQQTIPSTTAETSIDLQHPAAGLYQVRVVAGEVVQNLKVIVE
jgi:hypothetical protein